MDGPWEEEIKIFTNEEGLSEGLKWRGGGY